MKIKITTGFGADEKFTINSDEAHKAYYLFNNPEKRGTFSNGVALTGKNITSIQPDWHATMGWNPTHRLDDDDWNDIKGKGIDKEINMILENAQRVAKIAEKDMILLEQPLGELIQKTITSPTDKLISDVARGMQA